MRALNGNRPGLVQRIARVFAERMRPPDSYLMREIGIPGGRVEDGLSLASYNPDLVGAEWFAKVDEMLLSSSQAAVIELAVTLPIVSAEWTVRGGSNELRELVETSLFGSQGMSTTWREVLYNACQAALYGTAVFEIIWKELDGALVVRRLVDRDPGSVDRYEFDADGGLAGIVQVGTDPETGDEVERAVKVDKLLLFPYRLRRREYHGRSILRPGYRHFESIRMLCSFADIGLDHSLVGVPIGRAPQGAKDAAIETFRAMLASIRRHESSGLVMPHGWDIVDGVKLGGSDQVGFLDYIQWHEGALLRAALASFMQLGSTKTGTTELSGDLMDFSLMSWGALADMIAGVVNRHLVRRICDYNAPGLQEADYPELAVQPIREVFGSRQEAGQFLTAVANGKEQVPAEPAQRAEAVRAGLRLPEGADRGEGSGARGEQSQAGSSARLEAAERFIPALRTFAEDDVAAAVSRVRADGAAGRDAWQAEMTPRLEALLSNLLRQVAVADGDEERLADIAPPAALVADLAGAIGAWIAGVRVAAAARLAAETGTVSPGLDDPAPTAAEASKAANIAAHLAGNCRFAVVGGALRGEGMEQLASAFAKAVDTRLRGDLTTAAREAAAGVSDA